MKIAIVGECPSDADCKGDEPFLGQSGRLLSDMLHEARIIRRDCYITHVFLEKPPYGDINNWCVKKKEADEQWKELGNAGKYPFKSIGSGKYIAPPHLVSLNRLRQELIEINPNVILCLGATALWALTGASGINKNRGTVVEVDLGGTRSFKIIPTFHPTYVLRKWDGRPIVIADMMKTKAESHSPKIHRPKRELWLEPSIEDMEDFWVHHLAREPDIAWDIETIPKAGIITCIGFGTKTHAICIPFYDARKENGSYWDNPKDEVHAWNMIQAWLSGNARKITQNGVYDMQWVWKKHGFFPRGELEDTQLMHHSMYPEMKKDLGTLGSLYTNEIAWKQLNPARKTIGKKDD